MKKRKVKLINFYFGILILLFISILSIQLLYAQSIEYDRVNFETWSASQNNFNNLIKDLSDPNKANEINTLIKSNSLSELQRQNLFKKLAGYDISGNINLNGFGSKNLGISVSSDNKLVITDGNVYLNLKAVTSGFYKHFDKVEYKDGKFIIDYGVGKPSGGKLIIDRGGTDKDGKLNYGLGTNSLKESDLFFMFEGTNKNSQITFGSEGVVLEGETKLILAKKSDDKYLHFTRNNVLNGEKSIFSIYDDNHFKLDNINVEVNVPGASEYFNLRTPSGKLTDVFIGEENPPKDLVQSINVNRKTIDIKGIDIVVDLRNNPKTEDLYKISTDGNNIIIRAGLDTLYKVDGKNTEILRKSKGFFDILGRFSTDDWVPLELKNLQDNNVISSKTLPSRVVNVCDYNGICYLQLGEKPEIKKR